MGDNFSLQGLGMRLRDIDPDIRHMAISDLSAVIEAGQVRQLGIAEEAEVVGDLMGIITRDPVPGVREVAVRCVELLATRLGFTDPAQGRRMLVGLTQSLVASSSGSSGSGSGSGRDREEEGAEMCANALGVLLRAAAAAAAAGEKRVRGDGGEKSRGSGSGWETGDEFYTAVLGTLAAERTGDQARERLMGVLDLVVQLFPGRYTGPDRSPMRVVLPCLDSSKAALRRQAVNIVGHYYSHAPTLCAATDEANDTELADLVERIILPKLAAAAAAAAADSNGISSAGAVSAQVSREKLCGYIRCLAEIRAPQGIIRHVPRVVDTLVKVIGAVDDTALAEEGDAYNNVREACFNALWALHKVASAGGNGNGSHSNNKRYPPLCTALWEHAAQLSYICLSFAGYDPNRRTDWDDDDDDSNNGDGDESMGCDDTAEEEEEEENFFNADDLDALDDDTTWKVRRAAVQCLGAVLAVQQEGGPMARSVTEVAVAGLAARLKTGGKKEEEEECVILDILAVLKGVAGAPAAVAGSDISIRNKIRDTCIDTFVSESLKKGNTTTTTTTTTTINSRGRIMTACLDVLSTLFSHLSSSQTEDVNIDDSNNTSIISNNTTLAEEILDTKLVPNLIASFGSNNSICTTADTTTNEYKMEVLRFAETLLRAYSNSTCNNNSNNHSGKRADLERFVVAVLEGEAHPPAVAEAARCAAIIATADPACAASDGVGAGLVRVLKRPAPPPLHEAKRVAVECLGKVVAVAAAASPPASRDIFLAAVVAATDDEMILCPALQALRCAAPAIATSATAGPAEVVPRLLRSLASIDRQTKQAALQCLDAVFAAETSDALEAACAPQAVVVASAAGDLLGEADMHQSSVALRLAARTTRFSGCRAAIEERVLPRAVALCLSPLVQQEVLDSLCMLFTAYAAMEGVSGEDVLALAARILETAKPAGTVLTAQTNVALCVAALVAGTDKLTPAQILGFASGQMLPLLAPDASCGQRTLGSALLGAFGRALDLSSLPLPSLANLLAQTTGSPSGKEAAVIAVGRLCVGAPGHFVPQVLAAITNADAISTGVRCGFVHALCTFVTESTPEGIAPHLAGLLQTLDACLGRNEVSTTTTAAATADNEPTYAPATAPDSGLKSTAIECYGRILLVLPPAEVTAVLMALEQKARDGQAEVLGAVRYALCRCEGKNAFKEAMGTHIPALLSLVDGAGTTLSPQSRNAVRREALSMLNAAIRNIFSAVRPVLSEPFLRVVIGCCAPVEALVRRAKIGPYEIVIDDGVDTRKAAFGCLSSVLGQLAAEATGPRPAKVLAPDQLLTACIQGLHDTNVGVQVLAATVLARFLSSALPDADSPVLAALNKVMEPVKTVLERLWKPIQQQQQSEVRELATKLLGVVAHIKAHTEADPYCCTLVKESAPDYIGVLAYVEKQYKDLFETVCTQQRRSKRIN